MFRLFMLGLVMTGIMLFISKIHQHYKMVKITKKRETPKLKDLKKW